MGRARIWCGGGTGRVLAAWLAAAVVVWVGPSNGARAAGALAAGTEQRGGLAFGSYVNRPTMEEARRTAVETCRKYKGAPVAAQNCRVVITVVNECFSVAWDPQPGVGGYGWASGPTLAVAQERALAQCRANARPGRASFCALDQGQQECDGTAK